MQIVDSDRRDQSYEEISEIARRAALWSHLCGCAAVLFILFIEKYDWKIVGAVAVEMVLLGTIPLITAAIVTEVTVSFLLQSNLPISLFVRTCTITIEMAMFSWILFLIAMPHVTMRL